MDGIDVQGFNALWYPGNRICCRLDVDIAQTKKRKRTDVKKAPVIPLFKIDFFTVWKKSRQAVVCGWK
jgi:hypothetical protein